MNLEKIFKKNGDKGFAIISACHNPEKYPDWDNEKKSDELEKRIQDEGYFYTVGWGSNINYEKSLIVYNYVSFDTWHENKEAGDIKRFRDFAVKMCYEYGQDSVCFKEPDKAPVWLEKDGNVVSNNSSTTICKNVETNDTPSAYDILLDCNINFINKQSLGFQARYRQSCRGEIGVSPDE